MSEEKQVIMSDEDKAMWLRQSKDIITSVFLTDPTTDEELGLVSDLIEVSNDTFAFYAATSPDSDKALMYTIQLSEATRKTPETDEEEKENEASKIITFPKASIVGLDGEPLT